MKSFYLSFALIGAASVAAQATEQILKTLPKCATGCGLGSTSKNCHEFDVKCTCEDPSYLSNLSCCITKECSEKEVEISVKFADKLCSGAGVTGIPEKATCAATGSSASSTASSTSSGDSSASSTSSSSSSSSSDTSGAVALAQNPLLVALGAVVAVFV